MNYQRKNNADGIQGGICYLRVKTEFDTKKVNHLIRDGWDIINVKERNGKSEFTLIKYELSQQEIRASRRDA